MTRGFVAFAMLAALFGAPRPMSAAVNDFSDAQVAPPAGTVTTIFVMRVSYEGNFAATAVTVSVAGATRPMALEQGSFRDGTWVLETTLPAGTWTPTFAASVVRGSSPTQVGPTVSVADLTVPTSTAPPSTATTTPRSSASVDQAGEEPASADDSNAAPAATTGVAPAGEPEAEVEASPAGDAGPASPIGVPATIAPRGEGDDPAGGIASDAAAASATDRPAPESAKGPVPGTATTARDGQGAAPATGDEGPPADARSGSPVGTDELLGTVLIFGLIGVAAVALAGTLLLAMGRLRRDAEEPATAVAGPAPQATATDDLLTRRTLQRARIRLTDDPILSALGVEVEMQARRARRTRRVATDHQTPKDA